MTIEEIKTKVRAEIAELQADERLEGKQVSIDVNAPLALIQLEIETRISTLQWVLKQCREEES